MRVEDCLTTDAALCGGCEVQEKCPGRAHGDGGLRWESQGVGVVVWPGPASQQGRSLACGLRKCWAPVSFLTVAVKVLAFGVAVDADIGIEADGLASPTCEEAHVSP